MTWDGMVVEQGRDEIGDGSERASGRDERATLHARFVQRRRQRAAWDAEEARDLRAAERLRLWTQYGCVTLVEYLEVRCGIDPRTALERIRVSHALGELPLIEARLEEGALAFSHVKELTRVVVPETEEEWVAHTAGKTYREVQKACAGRVRGDRPTDPTRPDERLRFWGLHVKPSTMARITALLAELEAERGDRFVDDDDKANALCDAIGTGEKKPAQIWVTPDGHAFANGVEIDEDELATAACDATFMGDVGDENARAKPSITEAKRRRLLARDGNRCTVPGCRSRRHLELHHVVHQEDGGGHEDGNLTALCGGHHRLHHAGLLAIAGTAPHALTFRRARADEEEGPRSREETSCPRGRTSREQDAAPSRAANVTDLDAHVRTAAA